MSEESTRFRDATQHERLLLSELLKRSDRIKVEPGWLDRVRVQPLDDAGMGSFRVASSLSADSRVLSEVVAEGQFTDEDGVVVLVSLSVDSAGHPFEVDVWRSDFLPVIRFPGTLES